VYWHRIAYSVLMVSLRIYSLTHSLTTKSCWFYNCWIVDCSCCTECTTGVPCRCCRWRTQRRSHTCVLSVAKHSPTRATWSSIAAFTRTMESWTATCAGSSCRRPLTYSVTCIFTTPSGSSRAPSVAAGFPQAEIWCATSVCTAMTSRSCALCVAGRSAERHISRCTATHIQVQLTTCLLTISTATTSCLGLTGLVFWSYSRLGHCYPMVMAKVIFKSNTAHNISSQIVNLMYNKN